MGAGGVGLTGLLIISGALYYTGYGGVLLDHMQSFDRSCGRVMAGAGPVTDPLCGGVSYGVDGITRVAELAGGGMRKLENSVKGMFSSVPEFEGVASFGDGFQGTVARLASPSDRLSQIVSAGPGSLGGNGSQRFQQAIDSFSIGQRYLAQGSGVYAMPWLMQGAQQPEGYGVLSQLALGDMYRNGTGGVSVDPVLAQIYYQQAVQSLTQLHGSDAPQAQQLVQLLPNSPQLMQQQLLQVIAQLQQQSGK